MPGESGLATNVSPLVPLCKRKICSEATSCRGAFPSAAMDEGKREVLIILQLRGGHWDFRFCGLDR